MPGDGYVREIPYTFGVQREMAPAQLALALLLAGFRPPALAGVRYAELGFGQGFNLALLAAANPTGRFCGNDILPAHLGFVRDLAARAALSNLSVSGTGFAGFADEVAGPFDLVALHGVWSWVGNRERQEVCGFLARHLDPAGAAYVSHNVLPGWAEALPLRTLLKAHVDRGTGPLAGRIRAALDFAHALADLPGSHLHASAAARERLAALARQPVAYLAHEYFNEAWTPRYVTDTLAELAIAGLALAGPAQGAEWLERRHLSPAHQALLAGAADAGHGELLYDFATNRPFRRDLFIPAGARPLDPAERDHLLDRVPFARLALPRRVPSRGTLPRGEVPLDRERCVGLMEALAAGPACAADLAAPGDTAPTRDSLLALAALGFVAPALPPGARGTAGDVAAFNDAVLDRAAVDDALGELASPVIGAGLALDRDERLFLRAHRQGRDPLAEARAALGRPPDLEDRLHRFGRERWPVLAPLLGLAA